MFSLVYDTASVSEKLLFHEYVSSRWHHRLTVPEYLFYNIMSILEGMF